MELAKSFTVDVREPWVIEHNNEVREIVEAYNADRPIRVPLLPGEWYGQHGWYADEIGLDYRQYYTDPEVMIRVQLEAARRRRELPICDIILAEPLEKWEVSVDLWPVVAPGWFGCPLLYREETVIANHRLNLSKEECDALTMPDPVEGGILATCSRFWKYMRRTYEGKLTFLGRPLSPIGHGVGTNGILCLALDLRGPDILLDMIEDPHFAQRFLFRVADWCDILEKTWQGLSAEQLHPCTSSPAGISDHGIDMLSAEMYEEFIVPLVIYLNNRRGAKPGSDLHHCGRGIHLFPVMKKHFGLTSIAPLTYPLVDIAKVRRDIGEEVWITALIQDQIVQQGPPERISEVVRELLTPEVKGKGRFALTMGDMLRGTPMQHRKALYEAVKEYGRY